jgi:hypothetical protein
VKKPEHYQALAGTDPNEAVRKLMADLLEDANRTGIDVELEFFDLTKAPWWKRWWYIAMGKLGLWP